MTKAKNTTNWSLPENGPEIREEERVAWQVTAEKMRETALANGWTKARVAREAAIPESTLSSWFSGTYGPTTQNVTLKVQRWLEAHGEALKVDGRYASGPDYVATPTSKKIMTALRFAHQASEFCVITLAAGLGKTATCREYARITPNVFMATMRPQTATLHGMLVELCRVFDLSQNNPAKLDTAIGEALKRKGAKCLLIIDEAQNLADRSVDQLRYFLDAYSCGIALVGNEEVYRRFGGGSDKPAYSQINRRVGFRIRQMKPQRDDVTMILNAWKIDDRDCRRLLAAIGQKGGGLGQITKTIQLASMGAIGEGKPMSADHIREAWSNRSVEGVA